MKTEFKKQLKTSRILFLAMLTLFATACSTDDSPEEVEPEPPVVVNPPITLDCDFFSTDQVLVDDPEAPVDYIINCMARVKSDLIIEPGVVIAFDTDAGMKIEADGSMVASGTANKPILFTGLIAQRGSWAGIAFLSPSVVNKMEYVTIEYGGGKKIHANVEKANLTVSYSTRLEMDHCTLRQSENYGIYVYFNTEQLHIENSVFTENVMPVVSAMTPQLMTTWNASNDYSGNDEDRVHLRGHASPSGSSGLETSTTWQKINVPYLLSGNLTTVNDLTALTVEAGVHVFVAQGVAIRTGDHTTFQFVGTEQEPIIFEGATATPGSWDGFRLHNTINSTMEHMIIAHAAGTNQTFAYEAAIGIRYGSTVGLHNIAFQDLYGCAVKNAGSGNIISTSNITVDNSNTGDVDTADCIF